MKPYRTAATLVLFGLMELVLVWMCPHETRSVIVPVVATNLVALGIAAAGKSAFEHWTSTKVPQA